MASISPFLISSTKGVTSCECKFWGTLVFNHLPPSDHERHISQSTSSGLRRLNRGSYCTLKFSLPFHIIHTPRGSQLALSWPRIDQTILLLRQWTPTRVSIFIKMDELQRYQILSMVLICLQDHPCQVSRLTQQVCSINCSSIGKSTVLGQKSIVAYV